MATQALRVVVADIDGCLTPGEARPWDLEVLSWIASWNERARAGAAPFGLTLCTGRQEPYVEAVMQAIGGYLPAIYENGGGLYFPHPYRFVEHPQFTRERRAQLAEMRACLEHALVDEGLAQIQPGKQVTLTLYPGPRGRSLPEIAELARRALGSALDGFSLYDSVSSVEILPPGVDKGAGVAWLAGELAIALDAFGGIGDAPADLTFLSRVGRTAAPANAAAEVKARVEFVSQYEDARGVREIWQKWLDEAGV